MTADIASMQLLPPTESEGQRVPDRRESAWQDPRTWVSVLGILLTIALAILGFIASQLASINQSVQSTRAPLHGHGC